MYSGAGARWGGQLCLHRVGPRGATYGHWGRGVPNDLRILTDEQRQLDINRNREEPIEYQLTFTIDNPNLSYLFRLTYFREDVGPQSDNLVVIENTPGISNEQNNLANGTYVVRVDETEIIGKVLSERLEDAGEDGTGDPSQDGDGDGLVFGPQGVILVRAILYRTGELPQDDAANSDRFDEANFSFQYDLEGPDGPILSAILPGERSVVVEWASAGENAAFYEVEYCPGLTDENINELDDRNLLEPLDVGADLDALTSNPIYVVGVMPCVDDNIEGDFTLTDVPGPRANSDIAVTSTQTSLRRGIEAETWVAFRINSIDPEPWRNRTPPERALVYAVRTEQLTDFFERQIERGDGEDGGFCFVATAAHGSYAHPVVAFLRTFRDEVLGRMPLGRTVVRLYYDYSPPLAAALHNRPTLAAWARGILMGLVITLSLGAMALVGLVFRFLLRGFQGITAHRTLGFFLMLMALGWSSESFAQFRGDPIGPVGWAFEFKGGPFLPEVATTSAWEEVYGEDRTSVLFNLGLELQLLRRQPGTFSIQGTVGFTKWDGRALLESGQSGPEGSSTFNLIPFTLTAGYRFDYLMDRAKIPIAPYIRGGLGYYFWWNNRDDGGFSRATVDGERQIGYGGKPGFVATAGVSLLLNFISPLNAGQLRDWTGIRSTYLFFEGQLSSIDGFGAEGFDFSELTWFAGFSLEI